MELPETAMDIMKVADLCGIFVNFRACSGV
jgi:hypothetical protein